MTAQRTRRKPTGTRLQTVPLVAQSCAPISPEQALLESELRHIEAELDYPMTKQYRDCLGARKAEIERRLATMKAQAV
jgi:hypothetical protein